MDKAVATETATDMEHETRAQKEAFTCCGIAVE
jgi:hypothetical protein